MKRSVLSCVLIAAILLSLAACGVSQPTWQDQYDLGCRCLFEGDYKEAIQAFTAAIEIDATQVSAYMGRAEAYCLSGDSESNYRAALTDYSQVITLDCTYTDAYAKLAALYLSRGEQDLAQSILEEGLSHTNSPELEEALQEISPEDLPVTVTFTAMDHSVYSDSGSTKVELIYDLATLSGGDAAAVDAINRFLQEEYIKYQEEIPTLNVEDLFDFMGVGGVFYYNIRSHETYNDGKYLSLLYGTDWMMGGVHNYIPFGYTFDLTTGQQATLDALFSLDSTYLLDHIKMSIRRYLVENDLCGTDMDNQFQEATIEGYTLDSLDYYISEKGELVICIPVYELASGAAGSFTIPCGIYLGSEVSTTAPPAQSDIQHATFIGKPVSELLSCYSGNYILDYYAGSTFIRFDDSPLYFLGFVSETVTDDLLIRQIIAPDRHLLLDSIESGVTYPELVQMVGDAVVLAEPEFYYSDLEGRDIYELSFQYRGHNFLYSWYDDPMTTPADSVWLQNMDVSVTP